MHAKNGKGKMRKIKKIIYAFTLAEVLVVLVVVGVVSGLAIPSLVKNLKNKDAVVRLKKTYSILSQATKQIILEEGSVINWVTSSENIYNLYKKHLRNVKECKQEEGCWGQGTLAYLDKSGTTNWNNTLHRTLILADGVQVMFSDSNYSSTCTKSETNRWQGSINYCNAIQVDVNGEKKPNIVGRDIFSFVLKKDGLYPAGCDYTDSCNTVSTAGYGCACRVLREGAINY